jgi:hypothetical protein
MMPGMPQTPATVSATIMRPSVMGYTTSRSGSSVVSTPNAKSGTSAHPSVTIDPAPMMMSEASCSSAKPRNTSAATIPASTPRP